MNEYCPDCERLHYQLNDAMNRRAFVAQQVRDNGACMIQRYREAAQAVLMAEFALEAHKMTHGEKVTV